MSSEKERAHDQKLVKEKRNTARYFTERRKISLQLPADLSGCPCDKNARAHGVYTGNRS